MDFWLAVCEVRSGPGRQAGCGGIETINGRDSAFVGCVWNRASRSLVSDSGGGATTNLHDRYLSDETPVFFLDAAVRDRSDLAII